ncbi:alpha/beta fold hydrolase [Pendulispora brunnea]|uniref:Alpha/beta fold hydrolase n=1 Tax=Pendulispora brunnea TaxID=2905690 RepID=A0ABZ2KDQ7_9BACT
MSTRSGERVVRANGVDICVETFGDAGDSPILLIMGRAASMDWWEPAFCERLAAGHHFVVRYDQRDTGRSMHDAPGAPQYGSRDLVDDAAGLLDALGLARAHVVGMSSGGAIAQLFALNHPGKLASLTLMSTSALHPGLPKMSDELRAYFEHAAQAPLPDWSDRAAVIDFIVEGARPFAAHPFDEAGVRDIAAHAVDRDLDIASAMLNHDAMRDDGEGPWWPRLGEITVPTLVMHGDEDPLFHLEHGRALARAIPVAELLVLEHVGHEVPRSAWDRIIDAILRHTGRKRQSSVGGTL